LIKNFYDQNLFDSFENDKKKCIIEEEAEKLFDILIEGPKFLNISDFKKFSLTCKYISNPESEFLKEIVI